MMMMRVSRLTLLNSASYDAVPVYNPLDIKPNTNKRYENHDLMMMMMMTLLSDNDICARAKNRRNKKATSTTTMTSLIN